MYKDTNKENDRKPKIMQDTKVWWHRLQTHANENTATSKSVFLSAFVCSRASNAVMYKMKELKIAGTISWDGLYYNVIFTSN